MTVFIACKRCHAIGLTIAEQRIGRHLSMSSCVANGYEYASQRRALRRRPPRKGMYGSVRPAGAQP